MTVAIYRLDPESELPRFMRTDVELVLYDCLGSRADRGPCLDLLTLIETLCIA